MQQKYGLIRESIYDNSKLIHKQWSNINTLSFMPSFAYLPQSFVVNVSDVPNEYFRNLIVFAEQTYDDNSRTYKRKFKVYYYESLWFVETDSVWELINFVPKFLWSLNETDYQINAIWNHFEDNCTNWYNCKPEAHILVIQNGIPKYCTTYESQLSSQV